MTILLALLARVALAAGAPFPTDTTLTTADGVKVAATVGVPAKGGTNGVVFVHMSGRNKEDWASTADRFYRTGLLVASVDLRGHGANATSETPPALTVNDWAAMKEDVKAAVAELRRRGAQRVAIVGAEVGANLALVVAADDPTIASVALLSPGLDYKGVVSGDAAKRYGARPILYVASEDDAYALRSATALDSVATGPHALTVFKAAGKGTRMLNREASLELQILGFVNAGWNPAAITATTPIDISVKSAGVETSGKRIGEEVGPAPAPAPQ